MTTFMANAQLEELAQRANDGDQKARSEFISTCLPYWMASAANIVHARHRADAEDLVQAAVLKLVELWDRGEGPTINTRSYVTQSMRHAYIDRLRSPRSRVTSLDGLETYGLEPVEIKNVLSDDLILEQDVIRRAYADLDETHRFVLQEVVLNGVKPGELVSKLGRTAPAVSSLLSRAKLALRRQMLIEYLADGDIECAANAIEIPKRIRDDPFSHEEHEPGIGHVLRCVKCRANWRRFAAVVSLLGVLPLLALAGLNKMLIAPGVAVAMPKHTTESGREARAGRGRGGEKLLLAGGVVLTAIGGVLVAGSFFTPAAQPEEVSYTGVMSGDGPEGVQFEVQVDDIGGQLGGALPTISVEFDIADAESWVMNELHLTLEGGALVEDTPPQLDCAVSGSSARCTPGAGQINAPLVFGVSSAGPASFSLGIWAVADGRHIDAGARGDWE